MSRIKRIILIVGMALCLCLGYFVYLYLTKQSIPFVSRRTNGAYYSAGVLITQNPFSIPVDNIKLFDRKKYNMKDKLLIADPFLIEKDSVLYFYFEIMGTTGADIGVAKVNPINHDLEYLGLAIDEPGHLSYPLIFTENGTTYLIPESQALNSVRLYEAVDFPLKWAYKKDLLANIKLADPTVFKKDDIWYMFASENEKMHLYFSDSLLGNWIEHPKSPVKVGNFTRGAGRIFENNGRFIRFGQDHFGGYGRQVYGFNIDSISKKMYKESPLENNPIVKETGDDWAKNGMHHIDIHKMKDGSYIIALDGNGHGNERIVFNLD
jgi:hypothetical protein